MAKSINDLYVDSQMALALANEANYNACQAIRGLVTGELKPEWFVISEGNGAISWSFQKPAESASPETQPN